MAFLRIGGKQAFGKRTVYDLVIAVILVSTLSRILTANARFFPSLAALTSLLILHILVSRVSFYNKTLERWFKGGETRLIADGEFLWTEMKRAGITPHDISEALRLNASTQDLSQVKEATWNGAARSVSSKSKTYGIIRSPPNRSSPYIFSLIPFLRSQALTENVYFFGLHFFIIEFLRQEDLNDKIGLYPNAFGRNIAG